MITVVGLGFVGLTTALGFCEYGHTVSGIDIDSAKLKSLKDNSVPFYEPELDDKLKKYQGQNFSIHDNMSDGLNNATIVFFTVGTPYSEDGSANLEYLKAAIKTSISLLDPDKFYVFVVKSTVPPSTCQEEIIPFINSLSHEVGKTIGLVANPEFLREGYAWDDFINPDRVVLGVSDEKSGNIIKQLYTKVNCPIHTVSLNSAEYIKYLSNSLLATLISYSNEMSLIGHGIGDIDIPKAFKILHEDKRWSGSPANMSSYVYPGCGFGGYCLPKDVSAFKSQANKIGVETPILDSVINVNKEIKIKLFEHLKKEIQQDEKICILGLAFKPESDDVRDTPAKYFIEMLLNAGYKNISAHDPMAIETFQQLYTYDINYIDNLDNAINSAETLIILTGWKAFKKLKDIGSNKQIFDFRYLLA